jgi:hypothetical protein
MTTIETATTTIWLPADHFVHSHMGRAAFIMAALDAGFRYATCRWPLATETLGRQRSTTTADRTSTAMPPRRTCRRACRGLDANRMVIAPNGPRPACR